MNLGHSSILGNVQTFQTNGSYLGLTVALDYSQVSKCLSLLFIHMLRPMSVCCRAQISACTVCDAWGGRTSRQWNGRRIKTRNNHKGRAVMWPYLLHMTGSAVHTRAKCLDVHYKKTRIQVHTNTEIQGRIRGNRDHFLRNTFHLFWRKTKPHTQGHKYKHMHTMYMLAAPSVIHSCSPGWKINQSLPKYCTSKAQLRVTGINAHTLGKRTFIKSASTFAFTFWFGNLNGKCGASLHQMLMFQMCPKGYLFFKTTVSVSSTKLPRLSAEFLGCFS